MLVFMHLKSFTIFDFLNDNYYILLQNTYLLLFVLTSIGFLWIRIPAEAGSKYFSQSFCSFSNPSLIFLNLFYISEKDLYLFRFYLSYNSPARSFIILLTITHMCRGIYIHLFSTFLYMQEQSHCRLFKLHLQRCIPFFE